MREEARRVAGRLGGTLRIPDETPRGIVVVAHPLPTHGGTMRNPLVAALARAIAGRGLYALRFHFRGVGETAGGWTGGGEEGRAIGGAIHETRRIASRPPARIAVSSVREDQTLR